MLARISARLRQLASLRLLLILLVVWGVYYVVFFYGDVPFSIARVRELSGGADILDVAFTYGPVQAYARLDALGPAGRAAYRNVLLADLIYPALLGLLMATAITLIYRLLLPPDSPWHRLNLVPLANVLADYVENGLIFLLLLTYPVQRAGLAVAAGLVTLVKQLLGIASLGILLVGVVLLVLQLIRAARQRRPR